MDYKLILASSSSRRREILKKAGYNFEIIPSNYDENITGLRYNNEIIENCAYQKALDVKKRTDKNSLIIGADTVVVLDNIILGKPEDKLDAFKMLSNMSNKTHLVLTSICLLYLNKTLKETEVTQVTFRKLTDKDIKNYIETKNPLDKAGSYGIQDTGFDFAISIIGKMDNVIGFPLDLFKKMLNEISLSYYNTELNLD